MSQPVKLHIFAAHWGHAGKPAQQFIDEVKAAGFDGIEMSLPADDAEWAHWLERIRDAGLLLITQQWETVFHSDFTQHKTALESLLRRACAAQPLMVNSHTGKDWYSVAQNQELIALTAAISQETGVRIVHEIHRSRFSGHPALMAPYLANNPGLPLNADLSHWCCACESLLQDQQAMLEGIFPLVKHIHARVGHAQGPQVSDFRAPEFAAELQAHLSWWDQILQARVAAGETCLTITPEFGPVPYTATLPYSQQEVSNAWELNVAMMHLLRARYAAHGWC